MRVNRFLLGLSLGLVGLMLMTYAFLKAKGIRINTTPSLPRGLWVTQPLTKPLKRGEVVLFCPPQTPLFKLAHERGYIGQGPCPSGYEPLLKPLAAIEGDKVDISATGIAINGQMMANSQAFKKDSQGRILPSLPLGVSIVPKGEVFLLSTYNANSFDGRYFGLTSIQQINFKAHFIEIRI